MSKTIGGYTPEKRMARAAKRAAKKTVTVTVERVCSNKNPEAHILGEFPMSCYTCHVYENGE